MSVPAQPTAPSATALDARRASLEWTDGAGTLVLILRRGTTGVFGASVAVGAVIAGVEALVDPGLTPETTYHYWLVPYNADGAGAASDEFTVAMPAENGVIQQRIYDLVLEKVAEITIANGYRTDIGNNVFPWKIADWSLDQMPGVSVADVTDAVEDWKMRGPAVAGERGGVQKNMMELKFGVAMSETDDDALIPDVMEKVRNAVADIYDMIRANYRWGGLALNTTPQTHALQAAGEEKVICGAVITVQIEFRTLAFKADASGQD